MSNSPNHTRWDDTSVASSQESMHPQNVLPIYMLPYDVKQVNSRWGQLEYLLGLV